MWLSQRRRRGKGRGRNLLPGALLLESEQTMLSQERLNSRRCHLLVGIGSQHLRRRKPLDLYPQVQSEAEEVEEDEAQQPEEEEEQQHEEQEVVQRKEGPPGKAGPLMFLTQARTQKPQKRP